MVYKAYIELLYTRVANVLADLGLGGARVGFEKDGLSMVHWEEIQGVLPKLKMINCSRMMDEVRWVKTAGEIRLQKQAADMLDDVLFEVFPTIRPGDSEREVHARIVESCLRHKFGWVHGILNSSSNPIMYGGESDVKFKKGDFVRNDYVAYFKGYAGHQSRLAILGKPSADQQKGYALTLDIHRRTIERCTAGHTAGDIYQFVVDEFRKHGIEYPGLAGWPQHGCLVPSAGASAAQRRRDRAGRGHDSRNRAAAVHWHIQDLIVIEQGKPRVLSDKFPIDQPFIIE